jgi:uncharacterized membrane protein
VEEPIVTDRPNHPHAPEILEISSDRLEAFSDGVFAIAITLLTLDLKVPHGDLPAGLIRMWPSYLAFLISFLIVGVVWLNHHTMCSYLRRVDRTLLVINLLLLMNVAFIPFSTRVLAEAMSTGHGERSAAVFYGLTLTLGGIPFNALWIYASGGHRHLSSAITPEQAATLRRHFMMGPLLYLAATLVGLLSAVASMAIFGVLLVFYMIEALGSPGWHHGQRSGPAPAEPVHPGHAEHAAPSGPPVRALEAVAGEGGPRPPCPVCRRS